MEEISLVQGYGYYCASQTEHVLINNEHMIIQHTFAQIELLGRSIYKRDL